MSVLITGMEMPKSCWRCVLSQLYEKPRDMLVCKITHEEVLRHKIDGNCPLIPAADVRPVVRGEWIWKDNGGVVCSECNDLIAVVGNTEDLTTVISGFNFCPNCGARMEGGARKNERNRPI